MFLFIFFYRNLLNTRNTLYLYADFLLKYFTNPKIICYEQS